MRIKQFCAHVLINKYNSVDLFYALVLYIANAFYVLPLVYLKIFSSTALIRSIRYSNIAIDNCLISLILVIIGQYS